jgi:delta24-sterol reductase
MEFPGITVGCGLSGTNGESTEWKEGMFDCSIEEPEMILGNGEDVRATQQGTNSDLFNGARCTLGTLEMITLLKVRLTKTQDAVQFRCHHTPSINETIILLATMSKDRQADFDFIKALQYSMQYGVIITGRHVSLTSSTIRGVLRQCFDRAIDP